MKAFYLMAVFLLLAGCSSGERNTDRIPQSVEDGNGSVGSGGGRAIDLELLSKKYARYCMAADGLHYKTPAILPIAVKFDAKTERLQKDFDKVDFPTAFNSLSNVLLVEDFLYPPKDKKQVSIDIQTPWAEHPITLAQFIREQHAVEAATNCQQIYDVLNRIADRNYRILKLVLAHQSSKLYLRDDDKDSSVSSKCRKSLISFKEYGGRNAMQGSREWAKAEVLRAQALGMDLHYIPAQLATSLILMDFERVKKNADCQEFVQAEKDGAESVNALDVAIGKVFSSPAEDGTDRINIFSDGVAVEVSPGRLQTRVQLEKSHDVNVTEHNGIFSNSFVRREGNENACDHSMARAKAEGMKSCKAKFENCKIVSASRQESDRNCVAAVYTQGDLRK